MIVFIVGYQLRGMLYVIDTMCEMVDYWKEDPNEFCPVEAMEYIEELGNNVIDLIDELGLPKPPVEDGWVVDGDDEPEGALDVYDSCDSGNAKLKKRLRVDCLTQLNNEESNFFEQNLY